MESGLSSSLADVGLAFGLLQLAAFGSMMVGAITGASACLPDLAPDQYGATAHRVGQRVMAAAHTLHYQMGIPVRKVPRVLETLAGLKLTQGAVTQDALRRARGQVGIAYQQLRPVIEESPSGLH